MSLFSIIVPTYNRAEFLSRCILSVINQSEPGWELLIIDDGSTDNTKEVVSSFLHDSRIKYFVQANQGVSAARNLGLQKVTGDYICFIDSDDEFCPDHLAVFKKEIDKANEPSFYYTNFSFVDDGVHAPNSIPPRRKYNNRFLDNVMEVFLPYSPPVQTICVPAQVKDSTQFNPSYKLTECYDFCYHCAERYPVKYIDHVTVFLHGHNSNSSVPRNADQSLAFNSRQLLEFNARKGDPVLKPATLTTAFKHRMQRLNFELTKIYAQKKNMHLMVTSLFRGIGYNPTFIFSLNFLRLIKSLVKGLTT